MADVLDTEEVQFDDVPSEDDDASASLRSYEIVTYPADYTLSVLVDKWRKRQIQIPDFQREFVWKQAQASKLIESFLVGLPVPAIFLYTDRSNRNVQLVVDGQQRLRTIAYFFEGYFGEPNARGRRTVFKLTGLNEKSPFLDKTYSDLAEQDPGALNRLNDAVLRAFVIQQLDPADDTSIYHVFERLNTGGTLLYPQEIRNAVNQGAFNDLLHELNDLPDWRAMYGSQRVDRRKRDIELILRVIALSDGSVEYGKPMKDYLNRFMHANKDANGDRLAIFKERFVRAVRAARLLGDRPFRRGAGLNAAAFDAVMTVLMATPSESLPEDLQARYDELMRDPDFVKKVSRSTTDDDIVAGRIGLARSKLLDS